MTSHLASQIIVASVMTLYGVIYIFSDLKNNEKFFGLSTVAVVVIALRTGGFW